MDKDPPRTYGLATAASAIRAHIVLILLAGVVLAIAALAFASSRSSEYEAEAIIFPRDPGFANQAFDSKVYITNATLDTSATTLAGLDSVERMASELLDGTVSPDGVDRNVEVTDTGTGLIDIDATAPDAAVAADLANAYAEAAVESRRDAQIAVIEQAVEASEARLEEIPAGSPEGIRLERKIEDLKAFADFQTGNVEQVQLAVPPGAEEAKPVLFSAIGGGIAGLLLATAAVLLLDRLRPSIRGGGRAEEVFGAPVLAAPGDARAGGSAADAVRARLLHRRGEGTPRSVLLLPVRSEPAGELAAALADSLAAGGRRTVLVDASFASGGEGALADLLGGSAERSAAIETGGEGSADRILSGGAREDAATLLDRPQTGELIDGLEADYDAVVIAAGSPLEGPGPIPLIGRAEVTLAVVSDGAAEGDCETFRRDVERVGGTLGGVILVGR